MVQSTSLNKLPSFEALQGYARSEQSLNIADQFHSDPQRAEDFFVEAAGLGVDYSKALLSRDARTQLFQLAEEAQWQNHIEALFSGEAVNTTEGRAALHTLLRASSCDEALSGKFQEICTTREQMADWATRLNEGAVRGYTNEVITDVVNIGIGGSDLGPRLASEALTPFHDRIACHYVSNIDPSDLQDTLLDLHPGSTLFIVCSKSFRTEETLTNALAARQWLLNADAQVSDLDNHFLAITTNLEAAQAFGIPSQNCLPLWDWVGGRYSLWSAVGLSTAIAIGWDNFSQLLAGAEAMDEHARQAPVQRNLPLLLSLLEVWYGNCLNASSQVVLPYCHHLQKLPDFLQQLTMESNGKCVSLEGEHLDYTTGSVLWGSAGTIGQHSFHQLLHQGTRLSPADFILPLSGHTGMDSQHRQLVANCLAQSRTLMIGRTLEDAHEALCARGLPAEEARRLAPHLVMPGNRPNTMITMTALTPKTLGALLALYEHRTFLSGMLWGINPFDQWGVELGKEIGTQILQELSSDIGGDSPSTDPSTARLMAAWREQR